MNVAATIAAIAAIVAASIIAVNTRIVHGFNRRLTREQETVGFLEPSWRNCIYQFLQVLR